MKTIKHLLASVGLSAALIALVPPSVARQTTATQPAPPPSAPPQRSAADLEKLAAPMALYPDPLIAVMLPAAAYPVEVVQAARFVANTNNLATLDNQPWDANVKAVARFPSVIQKMSDELSWTVELGQAFVQQPSELMDAIQALRAKAQSAGTLQTTPQQVVIVTNAVVERTYQTQIVYVTNTIVQIVPANPQVVYVPVYSPTVVYAPPPTYVYNPVAPLVAFGVGIAVGAIIANNHCDWHYGGVYYGHGSVVVWGGGGHGHPYYPPPPNYRPPPYHPPPGYRPPPPGYRPPGYPPPGNYPTRPPSNTGPGSRPPTATTLPANSGAGGRPSTMERWQPDQGRLAANGGAGSLPRADTLEARGWGSGSGAAATRPATGSGAAATRPAPSPSTRPAQQPARNPSASPAPRTSYNPPAQSPNVSRPSTSQSAARPSTTPSYNRPAQPSSSQGSAFGGVNNGSAARSYSNRGAASRGTPQRSGGGGGRGGRR